MTRLVRNGGLVGKHGREGSTYASTSGRQPGMETLKQPGDFLVAHQLNEALVFRCRMLR